MSDNSTNLPLIVRAQYVKDLSFENPDPIVSFSQNVEVQPNISVNIGASGNALGERNFEVVLDVRIDAKRQDHVLFIAELSYGAVISVEDVEAEEIDSLVMIEGPHLMFPYVRNIISDVIRDGGFPPLLLAPVDFAALYRQQKEQVVEDRHPTH